MSNVTCHSPASLLRATPAGEKATADSHWGLLSPRESESGSACLRGQRKIGKDKLARLGPQVTHSSQGTPLTCEASGKLITTATT